MPTPACSTLCESAVRWKFWQAPARVGAFVETCRSMARLVIVFLGLAFVAEYFLKLWLPTEALVGLVGHSRPFAVPVAALL